MDNERQLTIFDKNSDQFEEAYQSFITGVTPKSKIKQKPGKGGGTENYVNIYDMTEQIGLLTGFRWSSECLEEKVIPNWDKPLEVGAKIRITIWDKEGREYHHTSWGQKTVSYHKTTKLPLSIFDDLKSAYSDGIKKCLSYFGIARDVYGGKEQEFFSDDSSSDIAESSNQGADELDRYISKVGLTYDRVFQILGITSFNEITDYKLAYQTIKDTIENKK
jgi:hypothetical protein